VSRKTPLRVLDAPRGDDAGSDAQEFLRRLRGPALLRIAGRDRTRTRAFTTLLHGNEPSGVRGLHRWLRSNREAAVDVVAGIGAVEAALAPPGFAHRMLPGARDLNRCFASPYPGAEGALARSLVEHVRKAGPEALLDVHNNTGHNPAYAVATRTDAPRMALSSLFAEFYVDCDLRLGTLTEATEDDCPGVALECGRAGDPAADEAAFEIVCTYFEAQKLPAEPERHLIVLHEPIRVSLKPGSVLAFDERPHPEADLTVAGDIDRHNFERVAPGTRLGWLREGAPWPLEARGADGNEVSRDLFVLRGDRIEAARELVPMMMTTDPAVASIDCLFYAVRPRHVER
jgi:hypothetical protein